MARVGGRRFSGKIQNACGGCLVGLLPAGSKVVGRGVDSRRRYQPSAATDASLWWENTSYRLAIAPEMARGERLAEIGGGGKGGELESGSERVESRRMVARVGKCCIVLHCAAFEGGDVGFWGENAVRGRTGGDDSRPEAAPMGRNATECDRLKWRGIAVLGGRVGGRCARRDTGGSFC